MGFVRDYTGLRCDIGFGNSSVSGIGWQGESRYIRAWYQAYPKLRTMFFLAVVDREPLAELGCRCPYDVVQIGVVGRFSLKDFNADRAFLNLIGGTGEGLLDNISEKCNRSLAR